MVLVLAIKQERKPHPASFGGLVVGGGDEGDGGEFSDHELPD